MVNKVYLTLFIAALSAACNEKDRRDNNNENKTERVMQTTHQDIYNAAEAGDVQAMVKLADGYYRGVPPHKKDLPTAVQWLEKAASSGYADALYGLGVCADRGHGMPKDETKALAYFSQAAEKGHPASLYILGKVYDLGYGGQTKDARKALDYFIKAANAGHSDSQYLLARQMLRKGGLLKYNPNKALALFSRAAASGHADALCYMGICHETGQGTPRNAAKAVEAWKQAAELGSGQAACYLARSVAQGFGGVKRDEALSARLFKCSAELGFPEGIWEYGCCLLYGKGVQKDEQAGFTFVKAAADNGLASAVTELGCCYATGAGTQQNEKLARDCWRKAALAGDKRAERLLSERDSSPSDRKDDAAIGKSKQKVVEDLILTNGADQPAATTSREGADDLAEDAEEVEEESVSPGVSAKTEKSTQTDKAKSKPDKTSKKAQPRKAPAKITSKASTSSSGRKASPKKR